MELKISNLSKRIGNQWVLRDVDLDLDAGSITCICGPTGSGKTTFLRLIAGREKPNSGEFTHFSSDEVEFSDTGRRGGLFRIFGPHRSISAGTDAMTKLESSLASDRDIILFDEPFAGLDGKTRSAAAARLREASSRGKTIVFAAADFKHACEAADHVAILDRGTVIQAGTPREVYDGPDSAGAALITGKMNLIESRRLTSSTADVPEFQTILGGHRIFARPVPRSRLGAINRNMMLGIRPEDIVIAMNASFPEDNVIRAQANGIRFEGETSLVDFDANGMSLTARVFKVVGLNIGDECMLGLPPDRIKILS